MRCTTLEASPGCRRRGQRSGHSAYENLGMLRKEESFQAGFSRILSNQCKKRFRGQTEDRGTGTGDGGTREDYAELRMMCGGLRDIERRRESDCGIFQYLGLSE